MTAVCNYTMTRGPPASRKAWCGKAIRVAALSHQAHRIRPSRSKNCAAGRRSSPRPQKSALRVSLFHDNSSLPTGFSGRLLTDPADMAPFLTDWRKRWTGRAIAVALPDTTEDVATVVRWCATHQVPIVPQGATRACPAPACQTTRGGRWCSR